MPCSHRGPMPTPQALLSLPSLRCQRGTGCSCGHAPLVPRTTYASPPTLALAGPCSGHRRPCSSSGEQIITHFLSPNPDEGDLPRATWQHSRDTSRIWGNVVASSSDPSFVRRGAIPWLLLEVVGAEPGPHASNVRLPTGVNWGSASPVPATLAGWIGSFVPDQSGRRSEHRPPLRRRAPA